MTPPRNTATRDRHRVAIARAKPPCALCGYPINYDLPHLDPKAFVVDHIIPVDAGGPDTIDNKQASHRDCNRAKSNKTTVQLDTRTFITSRAW